MSVTPTETTTASADPLEELNPYHNLTHNERRYIAMRNEKVLANEYVPFLPWNM